MDLLLRVMPSGETLSELKWDGGRGLVHQVDQRQLCGQCLERDSYRTEHFKMNNNFEVGRGDRVRFWEDIWCSETPHYVLLLDHMLLLAQGRLQPWKFGRIQFKEEVGTFALKGPSMTGK